MGSVRVEHASIEAVAEAIEMNADVLRKSILDDIATLTPLSYIFAYNEADVIYIPKYDYWLRDINPNVFLAKQLRRYERFNSMLAGGSPAPLKEDRVLFIVTEDPSFAKIGEENVPVTVEQLSNWYDTFVKYVTYEMPIPITRDVVHDLYDEILRRHKCARKHLCF